MLKHFKRQFLYWYCRHFGHVGQWGVCERCFKTAEEIWAADEH